MRKNGTIINHKKILKIMNLLSLHPKINKRKKYSSYKGDVGKKFDNLLKREFNAPAPLRKLMTDVTEFKTQEGKLFLSTVIDGFNQEIISYKLSKSPSLQMVLDSVKTAIDSLSLEELKKVILHSDQGWQYQNKFFTDYISNSGVTQSMSRKGNCNDNGLMEGFFGILKNEMYYGNEKNFKTYEKLKEEIDKYIYFYNNERIKIGLNCCSPVEYKKKYLEQN